MANLIDLDSLLRIPIDSREAEGPSCPKKKGRGNRGGPNCYQEGIMAETYLAQAVKAASEAGTYDIYARALLADKQILAWIVKYALEEFRDMEIEEIGLVRRTVFGGEENPSGIDLMKGIIIHLRDGNNLQESANPLIAMLEKLFSRGKVEEKKQALTEEYGLVMTTELEGGIRHMCNWSENMIERGIREGRKQGLEEGMERGLEQGIEMFILDNLEENTPPRRILEKLQRRFQVNSDKASMYFDRYAGTIV